MLAWQSFCRRTGIPDPCAVDFKAMNNRDKLYPDISDILALKQEGRRQVAKRPFGMKIAKAEAMRERLAPLKKAS
jgi:hypothetical protein